jgi:signal peptidase II
MLVMTGRVLAAALVALAVDQGSKRLVAARLREGEDRRLVPYVRLRRRTRHRFTFLDAGRRWALLLGWIAVVVAIELELRHTSLLRHPLAQIGLGAALGGALANLWDRLSSRGIVDFVRIGRWPTFNLADAAITPGGALALSFMFA